ncbi:CocE/NonD family hydrolase [Phormidium sp. CCY1219]|uniref:CocE/NonD family hydrolase n=1 Tax=Phormidium sp. CCY1219 TaxID=2886104 RepID=UPI002D1F2901|nr:CocE/NonD family hydrolase [Phormidium sp. CCY1219]MEB3829946.1 CocE/NonD family hydrolase [Phormidium sp. CCY1219]
MTGLFSLTLVLTLFVGSSTAREAVVNLPFFSQGMAVGEEASGVYPRNQALYVTMRDGVKIAIDVWLPENLGEGEKIPALMRLDRYWRSIGFMGSPLQFDPNYQEATIANQEGYGLVLVDVRGSGASFGTQPHPWSAEEIQDYGEIVDWIIEQPWSNGKVGSYGISYGGNATEFLGILNHPAVKAIAPRFNDFDPYTQLVFPGGIFNEWFVRQWSENSKMLDANDQDFVCLMEEFKGETCEGLKAIITGVKPVDGDTEAKLLNAAIREHRENEDMYEAAQQITYRDDEFGESGATIADFSPYAFKEAIERSQVPMLTAASWMDAGTANGALSRFLTLSNPQKVAIGPWNHGGNRDASPYQPVDMSEDPPLSEQIDGMVAFFDRYLKDNPDPGPMESEIEYYTMGEEKWKTTKVWPPEGIVKQRWYFGADNQLRLDKPTEQKAADNYRVNFEATTGTNNRWHTQAGGKDVIYGDRAAADRKLLTYTSAPLTKDMEITGHPVVTLYVSSTATDGAFYLYLEDVNPYGEVFYLTEGQLRAMHRKVSNEEPPYWIFGPYHSFQGQDGMSQEEGEVMELRFDLFPTSVAIEKGHRLRVAIAGHDADTFARYPAEGTPEIAVQRNRVYPSHIELPVMSEPAEERSPAPKLDKFTSVW